MSKKADIEQAKKSTADLYNKLQPLIKETAGSTHVGIFNESDKDWCNINDIDVWIYSPSQTLEKLEKRKSYWQSWCEEYYPAVARKIWPGLPRPRIARGKLIEFNEDPD